MKTIKIITHPVVLISSFLFILISGEHFGGFYLLYLLMALPHGSIHSLLAVTGIGLLVASYIKFRRENKFVVEAIINILGAACLILSLFVFFYNDSSGYNRGTFEQWVPQMTLLLFGLLIIAFALYNIVRTLSGKLTNDNMSVV